MLLLQSPAGGGAGGGGAVSLCAGSFPASCTFHGQCAPAGSLSTCVCDAGYAGDVCNTCAAAYKLTAGSAGGAGNLTCALNAALVRASVNLPVAAGGSGTLGAAPSCRPQC